GGKLVAEGAPVNVVHDYFALRGQTAPALAVAPVPDRPLDGVVPLDVPAAVRQRLATARPGAAHASAGTRATEIVGFTVSGAGGDERWSIESGGVLRFWYLVGAHAPCDDLNVGIHFYDRRGILAFGVGTANRGIVFPALAAGDRLLCALSVRLTLQPGEYTLLPQSGGLTGGSPEPGLLHDRLEGLPPIVVTRTAGGPSAFYGLVELDTDVAWSRLGA
ncbi:MAG TPA: Wzt carbohydrate-binding domain-containing protein, partial [Solirubrobacteraceae bacterium]